MRTQFFFFYSCVLFITTPSFPFSHQTSHFSPGTMRRSPENFRHASDKDIKTFGGKYEIFLPPSFPSSLICNILWASCQPLLTEIKVLPLSCRDIILYEYFAGSTTNHICPLALIWLSSPTGIHIIHPSSSSPSVLHPSLIAIHNNSIKTSIQGLSRIIPDFKNKRYPSRRW